MTPPAPTAPRALRKIPAPVAPLARGADSCPHCHVGTLEETTTKQKDTGQKDVTVWECSACTYTEGR